MLKVYKIIYICYFEDCILLLVLLLLTLLTPLVIIPTTHTRTTLSYLLTPSRWANLNHPTPSSYKYFS